MHSFFPLLLICNFCQPNTKLFRMLSFFPLLHTPNSLLPITSFSPVPDFYFATSPSLPEGRAATAREPSEQRTFCFFILSLRYPCTCLDKPLGIQEVEASRISRKWTQSWQVFQSYTPVAFSPRSYA